MITAMIFLISKNIKNMKDLIITALDKAYKHSVDKAETYKYYQFKSDDINGMPLDKLLSYIKENNISPQTMVSAKINTESDNDNLLSVHFVLYGKVPCTAEEQEKNVKELFDGCFAFGSSLSILESNGYKYSHNSKDMKHDGLYDIYMAKNFDLLVTYFSLFFKKIQ